MLAGPIFAREALTTPRQFRHFLVRAGYIAALFLLMFTAGQVTFGWKQTRTVGDLARFGALVFQVFSLVQLSLVLFFALLFVANNVSQEKDRRTMILLLMTDMRDHELVLGKLSASLLNVLIMLGISIPAFVLLHVLGGVMLSQIFWAIGICTAAAIAAGSWGALVAFWREKTFQTLAISMLGLVLFIGVVEGLLLVMGSDSGVGRAIAQLNPYRSLFSVLSPLQGHVSLAPPSVSGLSSVLALLALAVGLNAVTIWRLRIWNPSRFIFFQANADADDATEQRAKSREVRGNPVYWREVGTRAYGRKVFAIKLAYLVLAGFVCYAISGAVTPAIDDGPQFLGMLSTPGFALLALTILGLILINAQTVTSMTSERDMKTLELLLVTDITAKEFIFGKLLGSLWNTKELILVPTAMILWFATAGLVSWENFLYLEIGLFTLILFAASLGLHAGLSFERSRSAVANSLGTIFFLFIGIFVFMILLVEASSSFFLQFQSFVVFIGVGSIALYASLRHKIPSGALTLSAGILPFFTFYAITSYLLGGSLGVCLTILAAYGFPTIAMLVPAISEFDMALGRTTHDR
ncbi:ABC transporter permease [Thalassoroseus pseudoceratinae]|uniref:ABC transporter permease n=1 Tax=Thalassoroseus pseudoceratinae TaxID=2713176 RepID=UPI001420F0B9|nr:ABC transporter permease [Thalassoroseus pseudoceratinae]